MQLYPVIAFVIGFWTGVTGIAMASHVGHGAGIQADRHTLRHGDSDAYRVAHGDSDCNGDAHPDGHGYPAPTDWDRDTDDGGANRDGDAHGHNGTAAGDNGDADGNADSHGDCDRNGNAYDYV